MITSKPLAPIFKQLDSLFYVDPEDLAIEPLTSLFKTALLAHDYYYSYSDDSSVYQNGRNEESIIAEHAHRHPELMELYQEYCKQKDSK
jgi:hypothetical protein